MTTNQNLYLIFNPFKESKIVNLCLKKNTPFGVFFFMIILNYCLMNLDLLTELPSET